MINEAETYPKFSLHDEITPEQTASFHLNGFIHFKNFLNAVQVSEIIGALSDLQAKWISENIKEVNGIPIRYGFDENNEPIIHRFAFTSLYSKEISNLVHFPAIQSLTKLLESENSRIGENEKDGVVVNHYVD